MHTMATGAKKEKLRFNVRKLVDDGLIRLPSANYELAAAIAKHL